jgi:hypothetical protein
MASRKGWGKDGIATEGTPPAGGALRLLMPLLGRESTSVPISSDDAVVEDRTIDLRHQGESFVVIADLLGYERGASRRFAPSRGRSGDAP